MHIASIGIDLGKTTFHATRGSSLNTKLQTGRNLRPAERALVPAPCSLRCASSWHNRTVISSSGVECREFLISRLHVACVSSPFQIYPRSAFGSGKFGWTF
jgi:hypothetical protein